LTNHIRLFLFGPLSRLTIVLLSGSTLASLFFWLELKKNGHFRENETKIYSGAFFTAGGNIRASKGHEKGLILTHRMYGFKYRE
jgi:hypothetical protein